MTLFDRSILRQKTPKQVKDLIQRLRRAVAAPPIDDAVLASYRFEPDHESEPRLTFVIPDLNQREAFGGVTTGIDIFLDLAIHIRKTRPLTLRLILSDHDSATAPEIFTRRAEAAGFDASEIAVQRIRHPGDMVRIRAEEIFVTYNWWTTLNIEPLLLEQARHFSQVRKPLIYLIQEYEPVIFPFSSGHMLAREAYDTPSRLWGVFNSSSLKAYFELQGHSAERSWTFEPVINDKLRPLLDAVSAAPRKPQIIVYGRPTVNRNCFPALIRGLQHWVQTYPEFAHWQIVSAGTPHDPVDLGDGRQVRSLGKLSLEEYGQLLLESSVGISLMASPHPSYPPLEMVHFGLRVVTNRYTCKDLGSYHPNMISLSSIAAPALAEGVAAACRLAADVPSNYRNPDFVRPDKYPFMLDLAAATLAALDKEG